MPQPPLSAATGLQLPTDTDARPDPLVESATQVWTPLPSPQHAWWQLLVTGTSSNALQHAFAPATSSATGTYGYVPQVTTGTSSATLNLWYPYQTYQSVGSPWQMAVEMRLPAPTVVERAPSRQHVAGFDAARARARRAEADALREESRFRMQLGRAQERARELLCSALSAEQAAQFAERGWFHARSPSGRLFRIEYGMVGNVVEVDPADERRELGVYCAHPREAVPTPDVMLAQKLHIEHDLERFLAIANRHR